MHHLFIGTIRSALEPRLKARSSNITPSGSDLVAGFEGDTAERGGRWGSCQATATTSCSSMTLPSGSSMKVCRSEPTTTGAATSSPAAAQLRDHCAEVVHQDGEVLSQIGRWRGGDEVNLLGAEVDPGPVEREVRTVVTHGSPEYLCIEGNRPSDLRDVDRDVMDADGLHARSLPLHDRGGNVGPLCGEAPTTRPIPRRRSASSQGGSVRCSWRSERDGQPGSPPIVP